MSDDRAHRLADMSWKQVAEHLNDDPRLLVPVGSTLQHGPHLPLGTDNIIVTHLAREISRRYGILAAPTLPYGAGAEREHEYAGSASLRGKTLHRTLNELVSIWEDHGVAEFVLMTTHGYGPHLQALATVTSEQARVRSVDLHAVDLSHLLESHQGGEHAGEMATSLILYLEPGLVDREAMEDADLPVELIQQLRVGEEPVPPPGSPGVVGFPSRASAEKGEAIFTYLVEFLGERVFTRSGTEARE